MVRISRRKQTAPIGSKEFCKTAFMLLGRFLLSLVKLLQFADPTQLFQGFIFRRSYALSWKERLTAIFRSDESSQRQILHWVQTQIPGMNVMDFTTCWADGIAMCALVESLSPGACPRYDLLKSVHRVNNCRLALKLMQKHLNVPLEVINAEDFVNNQIENTDKFFHLLSYIYGKFAGRNQIIIDGQCTGCIAKGSGLVAGMINKRCKINVITPADEDPLLEVLICGSNGEYHKEVIDTIPSRCMSNKKKTEEETRSRGIRLWKIGVSKILNNPDFLVRKDSKMIQFEYHKNSDGQIEINYVPKNIGTYKVSIKWKDEHVKGSPFSVVIAETFQKLNEETKGKFNKKVIHRGTTKQLLKSTERRPTVTLTVPPNILQSQDSLSDASDSEIPISSKKNIATAAAVLQRTSKLHRSLSKISGPSELSKQGTVTRRRVLKRIISKPGQEVIIHEVSPEESCSSQEYWSENSLKAPNHKMSVSSSRKDVIQKKKGQLRSFDFEGSYESDSSCYRDEYMVSSNIDNSGDKTVETKSMVEEILNGIVENVFKKARQKEHLFLLDRKKKDFLAQDSPIDLANKTKRQPVFFGRGRRFQSTGSLNIPTYEKQFRVSPFTSANDIPNCSPVNGMDDIDITGRIYRELKRSRMSEPSLDSFATSIDSESIFTIDGRYYNYEDDDPMPSPTPNTTPTSESSIANDDNNTINNVESHSVTVHTQMKSQSSTDKNTNKSKSLSSLLKLNLNYCKRYTASEPSSPTNFEFSKMDIFRKSLSSASTSTASNSLQQMSVEDEVFLQDTSLKLLTSNSMQKSCLYMSQKPIPTSLEDGQLLSGSSKEISLSSTADNSISNSNTSINSLDYNSCPDVEAVYNVQEGGKKVLCVSKSMPSLMKLWSTVDIDSGSEMDDKPSTQLLLRKRVTLGPNEMLPILEGNITCEKDEETSVDINDSSADKSRSSSSSGGSGSTSISTSTSGGSRPGSRRGSLARQHDIKTLQILQEEGSEECSDSQHADSDEIDTEGNFAIDDGNIPVTMYNISEHFPDSRTVSSDNISNEEKVVNIDISTQVSYDEIKKETGWIRPKVYLLKRRIPIKIEDVRSLIKHVGYPQSQHSQEERVSNDDIPVIVNTIPNVKNIDVTLKPSACKIVHIEVPRQSTIDTIDTLDSGIVDDSLSKVTVTVNSKKQQGNKLHNEHRPLTRRRYRGNIKLDPRLTNQNGCSSTDDEKETYSHMRRNVNTWSDLVKCYSGNKENNPPGETHLKKWNKQGIKVKRVKFSRRVLMYRRSCSNRSKSSTGSQSSSISRDSFHEHPSKSDDGVLSKIVHIGSEKVEKKISVHRPLQIGKLKVEEAFPKVFDSPTIEPAKMLLQGIQDINIKEVVDASNNKLESVTDNIIKEDSCVKNKSSSFDNSNDGFGISKTERDDLLSEINGFSRLSSVSEAPSGVPSNWDNNSDKDTNGNFNGVINIAAKSTNAISNNCDQTTNSIIAIRNLHNNNCNSFDYNVSTENVEGDAINSAMSLGEDYISFTGHRDGKDIFNANQNTAQFDNPVSKSVTVDLEGTIQLPADASKCNALGPGLRFGQVDLKNNFQVHTKRAGNGCLSVSITGPRPHTVIETSVTYIGDDIYDVVYEVKHPGFYLIAIKWSDSNIPESPYICKVTF